MTDLAPTARLIATRAHAGQVDKTGQAYIHHPERVAAQFTDPTHQAVAWLHDVIEDTTVTLADLTGLFPDDVTNAVEALTHRPHEPRAHYYQRVKRNPIALAVKLADIRDNTDPARLAQLDDATRARLTAKYAAAVDALTS